MKKTKSPFYIADDGKIHVEDRFGNRIGTGEPGDNDYFGGGYKIRPSLKKIENGDYEVIQEIVSTASGGIFYDNRTGVGTYGQFAIRPAINTRDEFLDEGYRLWKYDPLGGTIVNLTTYFVMGRGITINYNNPVANDILKKFWCKNFMPVRIKKICNEGVAFGDNFIGLRVIKNDIRKNGKILWHRGDVQVVIYDSKVVRGIEHAADNVHDVYNYILSYSGEKGEIIEKIIPDITKFDSKRDQECILHIKFNDASNDAFGLSDLIRVKEWLDNYQDYLKDGVIINKLYRSPCYDITITDGGPEDIEKAIARYSGWKIGSNAVHNDKEKWEILEFSGANVSQEDNRRAILLMIAAGTGYPEYMLADGSNSNLASTKSQQLPAIKKFEDRQDIYQEYLALIFDFVLDMKLAFGDFIGEKPTPEIDFEGDRIWRGEINFPEIAREEDSVVATYTTTLVEAGLMSRSSAILKNNLDFKEEMARMVNESIELAKSISTAKAAMKASGLKDDIINEIVNKTFMTVIVPDPTKMQDANKNPNN